MRTHCNRSVSCVILGNLHITVWNDEIDYTYSALLNLPSQSVTEHTILAEWCVVLKILGHQ